MLFVSILMGEMVSYCDLICIFLMISDVDHLFICLLAICISSLENLFFSKDFIVVDLLGVLYIF